jgi:hypothetical protein
VVMSTWECAAGAFRSQDGGTPGVTVADVLQLPDRRALRSPAARLVAGELAARPKNHLPGDMGNYADWHGSAVLWLLLRFRRPCVFLCFF